MLRAMTSPGPDAAPLNTPTALYARGWLKVLGGWRYEGPLPSVPKAVGLGVPHTSNMDGLLLVLLAQSVGLSSSWMIKSEWGRPPIGPLVRAFGGIPIDRSQRNGMVEQMVGEFAKRDRFLLLIPPEGTRSRADAWRSGFYRIALGAKVPVLPGYLDYRRKVGGFYPPVHLSGDVRADMDRLREVYGDVGKIARFPDQVGPVRLRDEESGAADADAASNAADR